MILSHTLYTNVNGISDVVDKIRQFAVSAGWTLNEHKTGFTFGPIDGDYDHVRDWRADVHGAYLCLTSAGQGGTQNLIAKIQSNNYIAGWSSYDAPCGDLVHQYPGWKTNDYRLSVNMASSTDYTVDPFTTMLDPILQKGLCYGADQPHTDYIKGQSAFASLGCSIPHNDVIPKLWMYGNANWIVGVALIDGSFCTMFHFGSFEMFDSAPTEGVCCGTTTVDSDCDGSDYSDCMPWDLYKTLSPPKFAGPFSTNFTKIGGIPLSTYYYPMLGLNYENQSSVYLPYGAGSHTTALKKTLALPDLLGVDSDWDDFLVYDNSLTKHMSNNRKPMAKCIYYWPRQLDGVFEPICQTPCFFLSSSGLDFGQTLDYDGDQYMVFPMVTKANDWAVAFRIA